MSIGKKLASVVLSLTMMFTAASVAFADSGSEVITLGANLNQKQKQEILNYFGVSPDNPNIIYVNNKQERKYLSGIAPEKELGHVTMSSSYVVPTDSGGINVKTSNITWVTSSMIATTLSTAGVYNANVVAAAPFPVSGTGALTGIIMAFEKSSGENLTEEKKVLANKELVTTGQLADDIGKEKATGIVNDAKKEVVKDNLKSEGDIKKAVEDTAKNYNVTLSGNQINIIVNLLKDIEKQGYNYKDLESTLNNVSANVKSQLKSQGEKIDVDGIFGKVKSWFNNSKEVNEFFNKFDDSKLSGNPIVSTTNEGIDQARQNINNTADQVQKSGIFDRIVEFFKSLFGN